MKTYRIILLALLLLTNSLLYSQTLMTMADSLTGTWYLSNSFPSTNDSLVYERISNAPNNWGDRIEFNTSHGFIDAYSSKCGNDDRIHNDSGTWELSTILILTSIPISIDQGTKHKVLHLTTAKLVLKKVN